MSDWISVYQKLPALYTPVWIYWRNEEVVIGQRMGYQTEPDWGWYSFEHDKEKWTYWWMPISKKMYPQPPVNPESNMIKKSDDYQIGDARLEQFYGSRILIREKDE